MAVSTSQTFVVRIQVKDDASGALDKTTREAGASAAGMAALQRQVDMLNEALRNSAQPLQAATVNMQGLNSAQQVLVQQVAAATPALQAHSSALESIGSAVKTTSAFVSGSIGVFHNLLNILNLLGNPENAQRIANMMNVLALGARFKGHDEIAKALQGTAQNVIMLSGKIQEFKKEGEEAFPAVAQKVELLEGSSDKLKETVSRNFEDMGDKAGLLMSAVHALEGTFKGGLATIAAVSGIQLLARAFPELGQKIYDAQGRVSDFADKFKLAGAASDRFFNVRSFAENASSMGSSIKAVGDSFQGFARNSEETRGAVDLAQTTFKGIAGVLDAVEPKANALAMGIKQLQTNFNNFVPVAGQFTVLGRLINSTLELAAGGVARFSDRLNLFSTGLKAASSSLDNVQKNFPTFVMILDKAGQFISNFSTILTGVSKDFANFGSILKNVATAVPPMLGKFGQAIGVITGMSGALFGLGTMLLKTDSQMGKLAGGALIAVAVATGGMLVAVKALTAAVGDFVTGVGVKLFTLFDHGIQAATDDEAALVRFQKTIIRLSGSTEEGQKRLASWGKTLDEITASSKFAGSEAQDMAAQVAKMGQEFGFSQAQQEGLLKVVAQFSKDGQDATNTAEAIRLAFLGTGKQAEELGLHVNDAAVNASAYASSINKVASTMTRQEVIQARYLLLTQQASAATALLADQGDSLAGIQHKILVAEQELDSQFAAGSIPIYKMLADAQLKALLIIEAIPQGVKNAITSVTT